MAVNNPSKVLKRDKSDKTDDRFELKSDHGYAARVDKTIWNLNEIHLNPFVYRHNIIQSRWVKGGIVCTLNSLPNKLRYGANKTLRTS